MRPLSILLLVLLLTSCSAPPPPSVSRSVWGDVRTLAQAESAAAPVLAIHPTDVQLAAAWIGADSSGVHHDALALVGDIQSPIVVLPLPPAAPYDLQLVPAALGGHHRLWLDVDANAQAQLYSAVIDSTLNVYRTLTLSEAGALCYDVLPQRDGGLWVFWYGGQANYQGMYAAQLDATGLVLRRLRLLTGGGCPYVATSALGDALLWQDARGALYGASVRAGQLREPLRLTAEPLPLTDGQRVVSAFAAHDGERLYLLWNVRDLGGNAQTWLAHGQLSADTWQPATPLRYSAAPDTAFITSYNGGTATQASATHTGDAVGLAAPLRGATGRLPLAVYTPSAGAVGVLYLDGGAVVGYQAVSTVAPLLDAPRLYTDRSRHLYLTWSEPTPQGGTATLQLATTR